MGVSPLVAILDAQISEAVHDLGALDFNHEMQRRARIDRIEHLTRERNVAAGVTQ
jgi:hypothetical protein